MKNILRKIHLYLSFISGIFILLIALSGVILAFDDEITYFTNKEAFAVTPSQNSKLDIDALLQIASEKGIHPTQFIYSSTPERSFYMQGNDAGNKLVDLYMNPYTGEVIRSSSLPEFFNFVESFHTELFLDAPGRAFIGIITILFLVLILSGLILWYPKKWNRKTARNSFTFKLKGNSFAVNYNLHKILGFYIVMPSIILCITGITMAFDPVEIALLKAVDADSNYESYIENLESESVPEHATVISYKELIQSELGNHNDEINIQVTIPDTDHARYLLFKTNESSFYVDRTNGNRINLSPQTLKSLSIKDGISRLHTGKMLGLFYKIILFITGLIIFSLPITGFIIWYKKRGKKVKSNP